MKRILITRQMFPDVIDRLRAVAEIDYHEHDAPLPPAELARRLADKDGALVTLGDRIDAGVLAGAPRLRAVANVAVGHDNIDLAACNAAGVLATNTPGVLDETTADLVFALLLASARRLVSADSWTRAGHWQGWRFHDPWLGQDVHHATLGLIGLGRIGRAVARRAQGFSMRIVYHNRRPLAESDAGGAHWLPLDELLAQADFVVVMVPYAPATRHLIGAAEIARMKPAAHLINVARGGVVDDAALIDALRARRIAGAALDVFENEPALDPGFRTLDNVTLTPHIGSSTRATRLAMAQCAAGNLLAALAGTRPPNLLNPELLAAGARS